MAERRMFAKSIVLSDAFLDMPMSARCLYFTLGMLADDDGFVGNPKSIMRQCGASQDDMAMLLQKRYVLGFESGIIVIKHWRINNYLRNDRYQTTTYVEEKSTLKLDAKNAYKEVLQDNGIPDGIPNIGIPSIGKDSIGKDSIGYINTSCPERSEITSEPQEEIFIEMTLNTGRLHSITKKDVEEWKKLYPAVDVEQELRNMKGWINANPNKRKTKSGINRFINSWLSKEQNNPKKLYSKDGFDPNKFISKGGE